MTNPADGKLPTPEQIAAGWKPHTAGPCPVPLDSKPGIMFADGFIVEAGNYLAGGWAAPDNWWQHEAPRYYYNIIAYLPESEQ